MHAPGDARAPACVAHITLQGRRSPCGHGMRALHALHGQLLMAAPCLLPHATCTGMHAPHRWLVQLSVR